MVSFILLTRRKNEVELRIGSWGKQRTSKAWFYMVIAHLLVSLCSSGPGQMPVVATLSSKTATAYIRTPEIFQSDSSLKEFGLERIKIESFEFYCDESLVEFAGPKALGFLQQTVKRGELFKANLVDLDPAEKAQATRLFKMSPFSRTFSKFGADSNMAVFCKPKMSCEIEVNGRSVPFTVWPSTAQMEEELKGVTIPNEADIRLKERELPLVNGEVKPLQILEPSGNPGMTVMISDTVIRGIKEERQKNKEKLMEVERELAGKWFRSITKSKDPLTGSQRFQDLSPEMQSLIERNFISRSAELGFTSKAQASQYLRQRSLSRFRFNIQVNTYTRDEKGVLNGTGWGIGTLR
jgi:hypothetical protein